VDKTLVEDNTQQPEPSSSGCSVVAAVSDRRILFVNTFRRSVVVQFAVAALYERRKPLSIQARRSQTAATEIKLHHYPAVRDRRYGKLRNCIPAR